MQRRRNFISLLGGAAAWPLAGACSKQPIPVIGVLNSTSACRPCPRLDRIPARRS